MKYYLGALRNFLGIEAKQTSLPLSFTQTKAYSFCTLKNEDAWLQTMLCSSFYFLVEGSCLFTKVTFWISINNLSMSCNNSFHPTYNYICNSINRCDGLCNACVPFIFKLLSAFYDIWDAFFYFKILKSGKWEMNFLLGLAFCFHDFFLYILLVMLAPIGNSSWTGCVQLHNDQLWGVVFF